MSKRIMVCLDGSKNSLRGLDAARFVKDMVLREKKGPTPLDREIARNLKKNWKIWSSF